MGIKIFSIALIIALVMGLPIYSFAQSAESSFVTKVGDAPEDQKPVSGGGAPGGKGPEAPQVEGSKLRQELIDKFGITANGYGERHLRWIWEKMWDVSNTNFPKLIKGSLVANGSGSRQLPGYSIVVEAYPDKELFQVIFIHEMGHVIRNNSARADAAYSDHLNAMKADGLITNYPRSLCTYTAGEIAQYGRPFLEQSEDYAEMVAYYLNLESDARTTGCAGREPNPYKNGKNPAHLEVARKVLGNYP